MFALFYGVAGCLSSAVNCYFLGTVTTLEKRFKMSSRTTGIIIIGFDISELIASALLTYYAGKGHRPRWVGLGLFFAVLFSLFNVLPHIIYGAGDDALSLTKEYGRAGASNASGVAQGDVEPRSQRLLCSDGEGGGIEEVCTVEDGSLIPPALLFIAQFIAGVGGSLYYTMGVSYMDDNIKKSKTPALISFSYFLKMLGPPIGFSVASVCLNGYISPTLTPTISNNDPRWLGAWWIGFIIFSFPLAAIAFLTGLFPKTLPRAAERKHVAQQRLLMSISNGGVANTEPEKEDSNVSFEDMKKTFIRLLKNRVYMINNLAASFYFFGYIPYWMFMPKYIETQYRKSASVSNLLTGTVGLVFSAAGVISSGLVISRFLPSARALALWNVIGGLISVMGSLSYVFLGCTTADFPLLSTGELQTEYACNADCLCEYVKYSPVCSAIDGTTNFISPCHAGCRREVYAQLDRNTVTYEDCKCISPTLSNNSIPFEGISAPGGGINEVFDFEGDWNGGVVNAGSCPIDCTTTFYMFLSVVCLLKFIGATGRATNFLVSVRCVEERDKAVSMGFGAAFVSILSFIPGPVVFGYIMDKTCLVWGKTCTGSGNCWLYNGVTLRYVLNLVSAAFLLVGTAFDGAVWYYVKGLAIYDDEDQPGAKHKELKGSRTNLQLEEVVLRSGSISY